MKDAIRWIANWILSLAQGGAAMLKIHTRRLSLVVAATSLAIYAMPVRVFAQAADADPAIKDVENSKFSTSGLIVSNAVFVRCGPGENYYPTMKLDKGAK